MKILDDSFIKILECFEKNGTISDDLLMRKYGYKDEDISYLVSYGLIDSDNLLTDRSYWLSGDGKNYLAGYRAIKRAEEKEESRWHITKRQAR